MDEKATNEQQEPVVELQADEGQSIGKTFTNEELERIIARRVAREKEKYSILENEYKAYKFEKEFEAEVSQLKGLLSEQTLNVLKVVKGKLSPEDYQEVKQSMVNAHFKGVVPKVSTGVSKINNGGFEDALKQRRRS
jgi:parvulin-like peptidyl-prolyl isomerase